MIQPIRETLMDAMTKRGLVNTLVVHFDGACEPQNPGGIATAGWTIHDTEGELLHSGYREVCRGASATNNVAEWSALGFALRWLLDNRNTGFDCLDIYGDSKLVICQLTGEWRCNHEHLIRLRDRCLNILTDLNLVSWRATWIPRAENDAADQLSQRAYTEATGKTFPVRAR